MSTVTQHYIEFRCPGTFVDETSHHDVPKTKLTIEHAVELAKDISVKHGAKPYGFHFVTEVHEEIERNGKTLKSDPEVTRSCPHYLDGKVMTLDDIPDTKENEILRSNMRCNSYKAVVETKNGYRHVGVLGPKDIVLQGTEIIARGEDYQ